MSIKAIERMSDLDYRIRVTRNFNTPESHAKGIATRRPYNKENHPNMRRVVSPERAAKILATKRKNLPPGAKIPCQTWDEKMGVERANERRRKQSEFISKVNEELLNDRTSIIETRVAKCFPTFERNKRIGNFVVDLVNHQLKVIIEVYGDYWHGNPAKFADDYFISKLGVTALEKRNADAIRQHKLEKLGFVVLTFWENDLRTMTNDMIIEMINDRITHNED